MTDNTRFGIAFGLFAILAVGFDDAFLDFVFILEGDTFGLSLLFHHVAD